MLKINKILSQDGFSLIELMVAVAILAMAIFGIFHAYSTGFMGMADARAVTVATNYAREAMEDIKNMDFDKIPASESSSVTVNGIIYNRQVIVQENQNIKRVITTVTWKDRNLNTKMVETDMVVYFIETTAGDATRIMLYASPYDVLILENEGDTPTTVNQSTITAVIKDAIGNTIVDWDKKISFSLTTGSGSLSSTEITPDNFDNGKAIITFTSSTAEGEEIITASTEGLTPDSVTINVYNEDVPVKINLTASPMFLTPDTVTESIITATIVNAGEGTVEIIKEINFSVSGPGTLSEYTSYTTAAGIATITLYLTLESPLGTITITASDPDFVLESGVVNIMTGGQITLSASLMEVPANETSIINVTTKDISNVPINYIGTIELSVEGINGGSGTLHSNSGNFNEVTYEITFSGDNSSETVIFTASSEGTVEIIATDPDGILNTDTLTLTVSEELTPHHLIVYAMPLSIPAGGAETLITAKVMTEGNVKITSYNGPVTFETTAGTFFSSNGSTIYDDIDFIDGVATVSLYSSENAETAEITVSSVVPEVPERIITGSTEVGFYIGPDHIELRADPQNILAGGQDCTVTAKIVDYTGTIISSYNGDIYFSISPCPTTIKFFDATTSFLTQKIKKGTTTIKLISGDFSGTAVIYAFSENFFGSLNIPVGISLTLEEDSVDYSEVNTVSFDINIIGAPLKLEEMKVSWDSPIGETINKISILHTDDSVERIIFNTESVPTVGSIVYTDEPTADPNLRIADIDVDDVDLSTGVSNVKIYFSGDMSDKSTLDVTFNPNSGDYLLHLKP